MGNPRSDKGSSRERELVERFWNAGFGVVRAPASGSATERSLPDIVAGNGEVYVAIEAKSSSGDPIYIDGGEIDELMDFKSRFGCKARIGVRFDREDWYFFHPGDLHVTNGGNYRVKKEFALNEGEEFVDVIGASEHPGLDS